MCPHIGCLLGALALLTACKSTPLDVVYTEDRIDAAAAGASGASAGGAGGTSAGGANAGGGASASGASAGGAGAGGASSCGAAAAVGACSTGGGPGQYALRSRANGLWLGQGAPTSIFGSPGFLLEFSADCRDPARSWQLSATATPNVFTIRNLLLLPPAPSFVLDVQMALTGDGTPVITFGDTGFDNQRFEVRARDTGAFEFRPQHHPQSCVSATADSAQITTCDATDSTQAWLLQRINCF